MKRMKSLPAKKITKHYKLTVFAKTLIISAMVLSVLSVAAYKFLYSPVGKTGETKVEGITKTAIDRYNVLVVGTDQGGLLTDTIMVFNVDTINGKIKVASIPRDTMVEYKGSRCKINSLLAAGDGNLSLLIKEIKSITGIEINYYAKVSYLGFRKVIDILGGVEIDVKQNMYYSDPTQNLYINIKKGLQVLNGKNAEGYVRFRHTYIRGDIQRTEVQRDFLKQLIKQKLTAKYVTKAPALLKELYENVETNFLMVNALATVARSDKFNGSTCFESVIVPGEPEYVQDISYYIADEPAAQALFKTKFSLNPDDNTEEISSSSDISD